MILEKQGKLNEAEAFYREAIESFRRLHKDDHEFVAVSQANLGLLAVQQGKLSVAESLLKESLDMKRRLSTTDQFGMAVSMMNLASVYSELDKLNDAETLFKEAMTILERTVRGDHPILATALENRSKLCFKQGKFNEEIQCQTKSYEMRRRLYKTDHPSLVISLHNMGIHHFSEGNLDAVESFWKGSLEMSRRVHKGDHPTVADNLAHLAQLYMCQKRYADAEPLCREAHGMFANLTHSFSKYRTDGETLNFIAKQSTGLTEYFSLIRSRAVASDRGPSADAAFSDIWKAKGTVARVFEQRHMRATATNSDPAFLSVFTELATTRRRRADLLLAPSTTDLDTRKQREIELKSYDDTITRLNRDLVAGLPSIARIDKHNAAVLADFMKALPIDVAFIDYYQYTQFDYDKAKPFGLKASYTPRYLAFVVTRDKVTWVDLDTAAGIEPAIAHWREAITGDPLRGIPRASPETTAKLGSKVRELVWDKVRKAIPAGTKVVYICPDADLCKVPFAALPGDKPGTILLEDFALATVPHAPFLLDKLWPQDPLKNPPSGVLAVGGVKYDTQLAAATPTSPVSAPLVKSDAKLTWKFLDSAAGEAKGIANLAERKKFPTTRLEAEQATSAAVLAALPKAKHAHFATHGFFADPSFRGLFQLDEKDYERTRRGERIGRAINSPLVMTGLVFAGANDPKTPGRGIVTGEALVDLDLSGMELAVFSACETGLGDVAGGEGVFGLQRAFHLAGTRNVVASLWKVPDAATAALMGEFYKALWEENLPPMLALQKAQLAVYKADAKQFETMVLRSPVTGTKNFDNVKIAPPIGVNANGKNSPLLWAAFTLSGPGR